MKKEIKKLLFYIYDNDKTPSYRYTGKRALNSCGESPGVAKRFNTPKEIIRHHFGEHEFWKQYKQFKDQSYKGEKV